MSCDCSKERLAVLETKLEVIHEDLKTLNEMHRDSLIFKGKMQLLTALIGAAWAGILALAAIVLPNK